MTPMPLPLVRDVVLIGGGHTHALVLKRWGMKPLPGARLTLINPAATAPYTGMLPGFVAGHYTRDALEIDLVRLARFAGARLILGRAGAIDRDARLIEVGERVIPYDIASLDIGITSDLPDLTGFSSHAIAAKPLGPFATRWTEYLAGNGPADIVVIGGGVGGVELSMAMAHALRTKQRPARITVIDRGTALPGTAPAAAARLRAHLASLDIELIENGSVSEVTNSAVRLSDGREIAATFTVGAAGARPHDWLRDTGLDLTDGFVTVDRYLRTSDPAIYAAGDCAHVAHAPRPKAGVYAVRAAPVLFANLRADLSGSARKPFEPQRDYLKLVSLGGKSAVGEKHGVAVEGDWVWRWKDTIDRRFMDKLADLPDMPAPRLPAEVAKGVATALDDKPLCGGCGSKVGSAALSRALSRLPAPRRTDVLTRPGDDAAILDIGGTRQVVTTDHLRAFTEDPWLLSRIAAIHAMGDIWAMGARPQAALATIILPPLAPELQESTVAEILDAASGTFGAEGAEIVGGHTTTGAELTVGFTVTGLVEGDPVTLAGARPGDGLILTKPIGSGTILAAEMRKAAKGPSVAACLAAMERSQGAAAAALAPVASAMTDVTGFGLAGHLLNILEASRVGARIDLAAIPVYEGAEELAGRGIRSTIWEANRSAAAQRMFVGDSPREALLFDPQTAGGLLAAVPADAVKKALQELDEKGFPSSVIGEVTDGQPFIEVR